jgi:LytS/YehU family sensor histidine kinase
MTLLMIAMFHISKYYFHRIYKNKSKWQVLIFVHLGLTFIGALVNSLFIDPSEAADLEGESYYSIIITDMLIILPISISMAFSWAFYLFDRNKKNEIAISKLTALNKESELNELKKQLNPHFLFNALSNIYSIAYLKDDSTPDKIMQLSKMLRYVIYETDVNFIELAKEVQYLEYYIDFQKFKIKKEQQIDFNFRDINSELKIAPLLLLPFIENAFKHSQVAVEANAWVKIELKTNENEILFSIENTISKKAQPEILNNVGIGLENIKKRLELIYKKEANLTISKGETFKAELKLKDQSNPSDN